MRGSTIFVQGPLSLGRNKNKAFLCKAWSMISVAVLIVRVWSWRVRMRMWYARIFPKLAEHELVFSTLLGIGGSSLRLGFMLCLAEWPSNLYDRATKMTLCYCGHDLVYVMEPSKKKTSDGRAQKHLGWDCFCFFFFLFILFWLAFSPSQQMVAVSPASEGFLG